MSTSRGKAEHSIGSPNLQRVVSRRKTDIIAFDYFGRGRKRERERERGRGRERVKKR